MRRSALWRLTVGAVLIAATAFGTSASANLSPRLKPAAPGPDYMTRLDHARVTGIADALKKKEYSFAKGQIAAVESPIARSLAQWLYFKAEDPNVSLTETAEFLDSHPDWPATTRIQRHVEKQITNSTPPETVLSFFDTRDPVTGEGKIQLARALLSVGDTEVAETYLRDAWINHNFNIADERQILSSYNRRLTEDDHAARVDRLLWARQVTNARRVFSKLSSKERRKAEARAALLLGASGAPAAYAKLSEEDQMDSGVLLAAVRHFRRKNEEQYAIALAAQSPKNPLVLRNSKAWWYERQLLMRWALKEGRFDDAYVAASNHGLEPGGQFAEAEFNAGWIALRFLNDPARAKTHFLALASAVGTPISVSRANYWLGRAEKAAGNDDSARAYFEIASQYYYSYYGQLAAEELGGDALQKMFVQALPSSPEDRARFTERPTVAALRMLADLNLDYEFMVFAYHIDDQLERPGEFAELARMTNGEGAPHLTVRAGKVAIQKNAFVPDIAYPLVFVPDEASRYVPSEVVLGLSRQESEFNPRAFSHAGARGMMQLIPETALITARKEGIAYSRSALLDDPFYNMTLGSAHLSHLLERFDGSLIMTFAAYNAGASRPIRWASEYGDPRSPAVDPVDWVELIPFSETRNYVQRVLENIQVYRGRLNNAPIPGRLSADLERGGPGGRSAALDIPTQTLAALARDRSMRPLPAVPMATAMHAQKYRLSQTNLHVTPVTQETPAPVSAPIVPAADIAESPLAATSSASGSAQPASNVDALVKKLAPLIASPQPVDDAADDADPALDLDALERTIIPLTQPAAHLDDSAAAAPEDVTRVIAPMPEIAEQAPMQTPVVVGVHEPAEAEALPSAPAPMVESAFAFDNENLQDDNTASVDECLTYRAFLAEQAEDEAMATDLNSGMLAELRSGTSTCD